MIKNADSRSNRAESNSSSLPPHISIEELHGHAKLVATTVLSRPKSGANFQADAKEAVSMWADRLSSILGPPSKGIIVSIGMGVWVYTGGTWALQ